MEDMWGFPEILGNSIFMKKYKHLEVHEKC